MRDGRGTERALPFASDPQNGALGQEGLHTHTAKATGHEEAPVQVRANEVSVLKKLHPRLS